MLEKAGFHVSRPLALFYRGWGLVRGAIITQAVPPNVSMADLLLSGDLGAMESPRLHSLVTAAARVAARLHQSQLSWRSMKAKHFYPEELPNGKWRIWLIDCEGAYRNATQRDCEREWNVFLRYFATHTPSLGRQLTLAYRSEFQRGSPACELKPAA